MAITTNSDVFIPQVIADIATDILFKKAKLVNSPYVADGRPQLIQDGGDTMTFPYWDTDVDGLVQDQVSTRDGVTPSKIEMGSYTEATNNKIISIDMLKSTRQDIARMADPNGHIAAVVANQSRLEIQRSLIAKAEGTTLSHSIYSGSGADGLTVDSILDAKMQWGENADDGMPGLFVHSAQFNHLAKTDDFKSLGTATTNNAIVNAAAQQGGVAIVHGCLLMLLDSVTVKGGTVSSITRSSAVATVTTAAAHKFVVGDTVTISGATQTEYNGSFTITSVPTATTFTYAVSGSPATPATGTPVITPQYQSLMMLPGALWFLMKQGIENTQHRHAGSAVITDDFDFRYCTTLVRQAPRRVVKLITQ